MRDVYIFDIDGTLAHKGARRPYDWDSVGDDTPNEPVCRVLRTLIYQGNCILYVSGRAECCRPATEAWLDDNAHHNYSVAIKGLFMRPDNDHRPDTVVKREIYDNEIVGKYNVLGVFDDRDRVVAMWRELGLTCFQVAEGNF